MNLTSEDLQAIFYSGYTASTSWDVIDELAVAIHKDFVQYKKFIVTPVTLYQKKQDEINEIDGLGPQGKGHMALKEIAKQWLEKHSRAQILMESHFDGLHPDVRTRDGRFIIECGTTDPACVQIFLNDENVEWIGNLAYPFYGENNLVLHAFSRGPEYATWQAEKVDASRQVFLRFHRKTPS